MVQKNIFQAAINQMGERSPTVDYGDWILEHWQAIRIALEGYAASVENQKHDMRC